MKQVEEARMPHHGRLRAITTDASNSPFSEGILECEFPKKYTIPTSNCHSGQNDPIQDLRQNQNKIVIYAQNGPILCRIFPSSLKGVVSDWFYSLSSRSIHNFKYLTKLFLSQYSR